MGEDVPRPQVALVKDLDAGGLLRPQLVDKLVHHLGLFPPLGAGGVDDVEEEVGVFQLLQGGLERLHQVVGELSDKAHRVGEQHGAGI